MSERPTPDTDRHCAGGSWSFDVDFARKLERERDEAREQIAKANSERENDTQSELAAWELLKQTRELARELRDALKKQQGLILTLINTHPTSLFSRTQNQVNAALTKAKEVLP